MKILIFLRSLAATILLPFTVLVLGPLAILGHYLFESRKLDDYIVGLWARITCRTSGVRVIVEGRENIPDEGCLLLFNHSSFFDIFALAGYVPETRFGAKAELFKIPVFGQTMRAMGTLPIARNNREEVYKIYEEARARFTKKEMFALSPEGGRFYGAQLSAFKAGPFVFAMSAEAPVVPVLILGAYEVLPKGAFLFNQSKWSRTIYIKILPSIVTKGLSTSEDRKKLQSVVYDQMNTLWVTENNRAKF
jgi:1-acyl-sn-glycerol-3-phosphate acyltransferase